MVKMTNNDLQNIHAKTRGWTQVLLYFTFSWDFKKKSKNYIHAKTRGELMCSYSSRFHVTLKKKSKNYIHTKTRGWIQVLLYFTFSCDFKKKSSKNRNKIRKQSPKHCSSIFVSALETSHSVGKTDRF
jgi:hypothetical protein